MLLQCYQPTFIFISEERFGAILPWKRTKRERNFIIFPLQVRYKENLPIVLHGVSCTIPGGMKIGIVGRTGSGKSTLIQALFRLIEPAGGRIIIDNIDISTVGLHDLRSRLSIIPQEPTLFEGTIRGNLDPLEEHSDHTIWQVHSHTICLQLLSFRKHFNVIYVTGS